MKMSHNTGADGTIGPNTFPRFNISGIWRIRCAQYSNLPTICGVWGSMYVQEKRHM